MTPKAFTDRRLFLGSAIAISTVVFAGFARSYYLRVWFAKRVLPPTLHVHGLIMTSWVVLFIIQTLLVANHRLDLHRKLGAFGAALAAIVLTLGVVVIVRDVERQAPGARAESCLLLFVAFDGINLLCFAGLILGALVLRRRPALHKRLMLMGTLALLPPALGRIIANFDRADTPVIVLAVMCAFVCVCLVIDALRSRRLHPALGWGGALVVAASYVTYLAQLAT